ncbi:hypothetical protein BCR33DRAFT_738435 [Rhizoclosmatium globosum]|uniref:Uncharacterized protein n=1 Tax=Rhizoclosmatium globosum TaxID=329046 RepID=A0A1Y2C9J1_9FUNG|nr:hypothetical protein BCR33DRAFT_738435 [Rhizoclosmatium globosum]|eukprot:ORY43689.1 hypothetical protein BCR33DRAFT_738435 [Rhizoclosmatium globosum]
MIDKRIAIIMMAETSPRRSTAPKPEPRPPTPLTDRNKIQLESLSRWLHGFEDDDSALKKHHSAINYPKLNQRYLSRLHLKRLKFYFQGLRYGGVELVNQDPDPEQIQRQHREVHNMEDAHTPVEIASWVRVSKLLWTYADFMKDDEEVQLRRAVKRTRFLLSRLGTALRAVNTADSEIPMNHEPMYDWHLRPATSHVHGEPKPELPAYSVGVLHNNEPTAMPILKYGWTWREIPIESETDRWQKIPTTSTKQNVNSLIDRGYVPQGADLSRLMAPTETNQLPIIKHAKMELNKPSTRVMDPIKRYSTFDRPVIPHLMKPQKKLPPLPDICTNTKLQKEIAKTLGIETVTKSMRYLEKLAYTESPQSVIIFKPPCPLYREEKPQRALAQLRFSQTHPKLLAPPATRQNSAGYNTIDSVRTDPSNNWTIFIMDGFAVTTSDAYLNFKTRYHDIWPQIRYFIWKTENLLQRYAVPCAEVKCQELILLASVIPAPAGQISLDSLQKLLFNSEEVLSIIRKPARSTKGLD